MTHQTTDHTLQQGFSGCTVCMGTHGDAEKIQLSLHTAGSIQDSHGVFQVMMGLLTLGRTFTRNDTIGRLLHQSHSAAEDNEDTSTSTWSGSDVDTYLHTSSQDRELAPHRHRLEGVVDFITLLTVTIFIASMATSHEAPAHRVRATTATRPRAQPEPERDQRCERTAQQHPIPIRAQPDDRVRLHKLLSSALEETEKDAKRSLRVSKGSRR